MSSDIVTRHGYTKNSMEKIQIEMVKVRKPRKYETHSDLSRSKYSESTIAG